MGSSGQRSLVYVDKTRIAGREGPSSILDDVLQQDVQERDTPVLNDAIAKAYKKMTDRYGDRAIKNMVVCVKCDTARYYHPHIRSDRVWDVVEAVEIDDLDALPFFKLCPHAKVGAKKIDESNRYVVCMRCKNGLPPLCLAPTGDINLWRETMELPPVHRLSLALLYIEGT
ncbi:hypothetical protein BSKO_02704 [Bryopsis sp. KO-2023]|nr:hypothetical protein BSKO_02704 [Bryopsis sp. KO-2023]